MALSSFKLPSWRNADERLGVVLVHPSAVDTQPSLFIKSNNAPAPQSLKAVVADNANMVFPNVVVYNKDSDNLSEMAKTLVADIISTSTWKVVRDPSIEKQKKYPTRDLIVDKLESQAIAECANHVSEALISLSSNGLGRYCKEFLGAFVYHLLLDCCQSISNTDDSQAFFGIIPSALSSCFDLLKHGRVQGTLQAVFAIEGRFFDANANIATPTSNLSQTLLCHLIARGMTCGSQLPNGSPLLEDINTYFQNLASKGCTARDLAAAASTHGVSSELIETSVSSLILCISEGNYDPTLFQSILFVLTNYWKGGYSSINKLSFDVLLTFLQDNVRHIPTDSLPYIYALCCILDKIDLAKWFFVTFLEKYEKTSEKKDSHTEKKNNVAHAKKSSSLSSMDVLSNFHLHFLISKGKLQEAIEFFQSSLSSGENDAVSPRYSLGDSVDQAAFTNSTAESLASGDISQRYLQIDVDSPDSNVPVFRTVYPYTPTPESLTLLLSSVVQDIATNGTAMSLTSSIIQPINASSTLELSGSQNLSKLFALILGVAQQHGMFPRVSDIACIMYFHGIFGNAALAMSDLRSPSFSLGPFPMRSEEYTLLFCALVEGLCNSQAATPAEHIEWIFEEFSANFGEFAPIACLRHAFARLEEVYGPLPFVPTVPIASSVEWTVEETVVMQKRSSMDYDEESDNLIPSKHYSYGLLYSLSRIFSLHLTRAAPCHLPQSHLYPVAEYLAIPEEQVLSATEEEEEPSVSTYHTSVTTVTPPALNGFVPWDASKSRLVGSANNRHVENKIKFTAKSVRKESPLKLFRPGTNIPVHSNSDPNDMDMENSALLSMYGRFGPESLDETLDRVYHENLGLTRAQNEQVAILDLPSMQDSWVPYRTQLVPQNSEQYFSKTTRTTTDVCSGTSRISTPKLVEESTHEVMETLLALTVDFEDPSLKDIAPEHLDEDELFLYEDIQTTLTITSALARELLFLLPQVSTTESKLRLHAYNNWQEEQYRSFFNKEKKALLECTTSTQSPEHTQASLSRTVQDRLRSTYAALLEEEELLKANILETHSEGGKSSFVMWNRYCEDLEALQQESKLHIEAVQNANNACGSVEDGVGFDRVGLQKSTLGSGMLHAIGRVLREERKKEETTFDEQCMRATSYEAVLEHTLDIHARRIQTLEQFLRTSEDTMRSIESEMQETQDDEKAHCEQMKELYRISQVARNDDASTIFSMEEHIAQANQQIAKAVELLGDYALSANQVTVGITAAEAKGKAEGAIEGTFLYQASKRESAAALARARAEVEELFTPANQAKAAERARELAMERLPLEFALTGKSGIKDGLVGIAAAIQVEAAALEQAKQEVIEARKKRNECMEQVYGLQQELVSPQKGDLSPVKLSIADSSDTAVSQVEKQKVDSLAHGLLITASSLGLGIVDLAEAVESAVRGELERVITHPEYPGLVAPSSIPVIRKLVGVYEHEMQRLAVAPKGPSLPSYLPIASLLPVLSASYASNKANSTLSTAKDNSLAQYANRADAGASVTSNEM